VFLFKISRCPVIEFQKVPFSAKEKDTVLKGFVFIIPWRMNVSFMPHSEIHES